MEPHLESGLRECGQLGGHFRCLVPTRAAGINVTVRCASAGMIAARNDVERRAPFLLEGGVLFETVPGIPSPAQIDERKLEGGYKVAPQLVQAGAATQDLGHRPHRRPREEAGGGPVAAVTAHA